MIIAIVYSVFGFDKQIPSAVLIIFSLQYGYRLPEDDIGTIYYQVYFRPLGGTLFTYPLQIYHLCQRATTF